MPSTVYGIPTGKLADIGMQNSNSVQMPYLIHALLKRGQAGFVREGKNVWPHVEVNDSETYSAGNIY